AFLSLLIWAERDYLGFTPQFIVDRAAWFVFLPLIWLFLLLLTNLYDVQQAASWRVTVRQILLAAFGGSVIYLIVFFISEPGSLPRLGVLYFLIIVTVLTLSWRWIYIRVLTRSSFMQRTLIVGAGESGLTMEEVVRDSNPVPFQIVGFVDDDEAKSDISLAGSRMLGASGDLLRLVKQQDISDIIVAINGPMNGEMFQVLLDAQEQGVQITRMPVAYEQLLGRLPIRHLESDWILRSFVDELQIPATYLIFKRFADIAGGALGTLLYLVIYPLVALGILLDSGRPIMYRQVRHGKGGAEYGLLKFRTMVRDAEQPGTAHWAQEQDPRTTRFGRFLRRAHIDEFPQFWNVLKGEMSIIGPRPERPELIQELELEIPFYRARLLVKPGITGWAQVNYGKGASIHGSAEKLEFDLYYIKHRGLLLDLWILLRTIGQVIGFRGV
ncbi:MAG: sugar transferase, partial [Anaerolineales bacterium]